MTNTRTRRFFIVIAVGLVAAAFIIPAYLVARFTPYPWTVAVIAVLIAFYMEMERSDRLTVVSRLAWLLAIALAGIVTGWVYAGGGSGSGVIPL